MTLVHASVALVVEYPDGTVYTECISVRDGTDGYTTLERSKLDIVWSDLGGWGHMLCKVNSFGTEPSGTTCEWTGEYWNFMLAVNGESSWSYSPVGFDGTPTCWNHDLSSFEGHYCANNGDVIGFSFGSWGSQPPFFKFNKICVNDMNEEKQGKRENHRVAIKEIEPTAVFTHSNTNVTVNVTVNNEGDFQENAVIYIGSLPTGWTATSANVSLKNCCVGREKVPLTITIPSMVSPKTYSVWLTSEGVERDIEELHITVFPDCKETKDCPETMYCSEQVCKPIKCDVVENHRCIVNTIVFETDKGAEEKNRTNETEKGGEKLEESNGEPKKAILYEYKSDVSNPLEPIITLHLYYGEDDEKIDLSEATVVINNDIYTTDRAGIISFKIKPDTTTEILASKEDFEDFRLLIHSVLVERAPEEVEKETDTKIESPTAAATLGMQNASRIDELTQIIYLLAVLTVINISVGLHIIRVRSR